ncbi:hypothetical protein [Streptomyces incanus]|uniref:Uncharacterized protein n=1 Tax=Streptomyces incanus TaxID=887453 RepID=A0ABW0XGI4_9ACTN
MPRRLGRPSYSLRLWRWPVCPLLDEDRLGLAGPPRTAVVLAVSGMAAWLTEVLVEDPARSRARWATGRAGALAVLATFAAPTVLRAPVPEPRTGEGSVDVTRLMPVGD